MLFHGRIDNGDELAERLCVPAGNSAALYAAAVEIWGDEADAHVIGEYCAVVAGQDTLRLARSAWSAPPLYFGSFSGQSVVASVPRVLIAAGMPDELDQTRLADNLYFNLLERTRGWYRDMHRVAHGTAVMLDRDGQHRVIASYDPRNLPDVRFARDQDYVDAAEELLAQACDKTMAGARRPGIMLSGGLDSPLVAAEAIGHLAPGQRLPSFTFAPGDDWRNRLPAGYIGDERPFVRAFAEMHPALEPHFTQNPDTHFDSHLTELFTAMGTAPNHLCNFYVYHGVWQAARQAGCDLLLTADFGNQTFSNDARWCYVEYLTHFRWRQLWLALRERPGDKRPMAQRLAALSLLRILPRPLRRAIRSSRHPDRASLNDLISMLPEAARVEAAARAGSSGAVIDHEYYANQRDAVAFDYAWRDCEGAEVRQGFEQVYGLRQVDVPAYRPLAEFCAGLPTDQYQRDGISRWLARRMAKGKLPEAQRHNKLNGWHNADWYERLTPRLGELRGEVARLADRPDSPGLLDHAKMLELIDNWPDQPSAEPEEWMPQAAGLTRGLLTARFIAHVSGRNEA